MNVLILCYAISPYKGSEFAFGWDYVTQMSKYHNIYLIYGVSEDKIGETQTLIDYFKEFPNPRIKLFPVKSNFIIRFLDYFNQIGLKLFWHLAFRIWHINAYTKSKAIINENNIDLIHTLNPQGFREPGYLFKLNKPHIWGPIGGANFVNKHLLKSISIPRRLPFLFRNFINHLQLKYSKRIQDSVLKSKYIVYSTSANLSSFLKYHNCIGEVISEMGIPISRFKFIKSKYAHGQMLRICWAGNISTRKNLALLFKALDLCQNSKMIELNIIGDDNNKSAMRLKKYYYENKFKFDLIWHGKKTRNSTMLALENFDLHAIVSLSEASTSILYEALSVSLPTISLNQDGMKDALNNGIGMLIDIEGNTAKRFAKGIDLIMNNPHILHDYRDKIHLNLKDYTWEDKIKKFQIMYDSILEK